MKDTPRIAALVLAAGDSQRMGTPKALLAIGDSCFLGCSVETARASALEPVAAVVGRHATSIAEAQPSLAPLLVVNPAPDLGQLHSLRIGLAALTREPDAVAVFLVDHPLVSPATVQTLAAAFRDFRRPITVPVFLGREVFEELRAAPLHTGARAVVNADGRRVLEVEVDDGGVLADIDTPEEYRLNVGGGSGD